MEFLEKSKENETSDVLVVDDKRLAVDAIKEKIDINNRATVSMFGRDAKAWITEQSDALLKETINKNSGGVGELLLDLNDKVSGVDPSSLQSLSFIQRIFGGTKRAVARFIGKFETVASQVDEISHKLEIAKETLRTDVYKLDQLYTETVENLDRFQAYITAGTEYIEHARSVTVAKMRADASQASTEEAQLLNQQIFDVEQGIERFERLVHDLKLSRTMALQMLPQIRVIQSSSSSLIDKLNSSIFLAIPAWKNQMSLALSMSRQAEAMRLQAEVSDMTNAMLSKNAEMLKSNAVEIEKQNQRGVIDIETLSKVNDDLISTVSEVISIQEEGRRKRTEVEAEMQKIESDLRGTLLSVDALQ